MSFKIQINFPIFMQWMFIEINYANCDHCFCLFMCCIHEISRRSVMKQSKDFKDISKYALKWMGKKIFVVNLFKFSSSYAFIHISAYTGFYITIRNFMNFCKKLCKCQAKSFLHQSMLLHGPLLAIQFSVDYYSIIAK